MQTNATFGSPDLVSPDKGVTTARRLVRRAARFLASMDNRGVTLVEFGFVGPMLMLLMMSIIDLGLMMTNQSLLDGAARDAARMIKTGQLTSTGTATSGCAAASDAVTTFQNCLCSGMSAVMTASSCQSKLIFDVETFPDFGSVAFPSCVRNSNDTLGSGAQCNFTNSTASQIVGVRVTYNYAFIVPWVGACLTPGGSCWTGSGSQNGTSNGTGTVALMSTVIMKNEPFPSSSSS
jgi:Flp pilus assembly protein TadG